MTNLELIATVTACVATVSALVATSTYMNNAKVRRAEFVLGIHRDFFVESRYKEFKELVDVKRDSQSILKAARDEPMYFTDSLNFFELVCYLEVSGAITPEDREALLGYYLDRLASSPALSSYIQDSAKGLNI